MNPLVNNDNRIARPAGRVLIVGGKVFRFTQTCYPHYGTLVRAFEISRLTGSEYDEREVDQSPVLSPGGQTWNRSGMHHIDPHFERDRWIACVDGLRFEMPKTSVGGKG